MQPQYSTMLLALALLNAGTFHAQNTKNKEVTMSTTTFAKQTNAAALQHTMEKNKQVVERLYEQAFNKKNLTLVPELIAEDYVGAQGEKGPLGFQATFVQLFKAFPDIHYEIQDLLAEGDKVVIRWKWQGTHTGMFRDYPPTGKTVTNNGMAIFQLRDYKIVKAVVQTDRLTFLQDMGVIPAELTRPVPQAQKTNINFIDKFLVPAAAKTEFLERVRINRSFLRTLPGFIQDKAYEYTDDSGNLIFVTVAVWESREAIDKAKQAVQAEYKREGFDMQAMLKRLNIQIDRGIYTELTDH